MHPTRRVEVAVSLLNLIHLDKARAARIVNTPNFEKFKSALSRFSGATTRSQHLVLDQ